MCAGSRPPSGWSATSAWTRACVNPEPALPAKDRSPNRGPQPPGSCSSRRPGQRSRPRVLSVRSISASAPVAARSSRSVAVARKLASLCWQLLTTKQDYAFKRQTIVERKLRALELRAGAPKRHGTQHQNGTLTIKERTLQERQLTEQAELAYQRLIDDWNATAPSQNGADAKPGRASQ